MKIWLDAQVAVAVQTYPRSDRGRYGTQELLPLSRPSIENVLLRRQDGTTHQVITAHRQAPARSNIRNNVRLTFGTKVQGYLQDMADANFKLYKRITDEREFGRRLLDLLFEEFWQEVGQG